jgi:hypothetical protein
MKAAELGQTVSVAPRMIVEEAKIVMKHENVLQHDHATDAIRGDEVITHCRSTVQSLDYQ